MSYKYKPSRAQARAYAQEMDRLYSFCCKNGINHSASMDSYYFSINGQSYRVSNHSVEASYSNSHGEYHLDGRREDTVYIHAGKTRIEEIYNNLLAGDKLDGHGNKLQEAM